MINLKKIYKIRIEFYDVDSMNVVWHGNYVKFLESARCSFLREIGFDYDVMKNMGYAYPVVKMNFKFIKPAFFGEEISVEVILQEVESFLKFDYIIKNSSGEIITRASTSQACVKIASLATQFNAPKELLALIKDYK